MLAATIGIVHNDIKKVLAYSTCSQLGYMMIALGLGGFMAGLFHLVLHACFKACLFLGSGSVIHAVHTQDMREMGGLRKKMPLTYATFLIATLALTGVPCFSGYFSKDTIIATALEWGMAQGVAAYLPYLFATGVAAMTMFYMMRLVIMTFHGEPRDLKKYEHAHESPPVMTIPLIALAVLAIFGAGTILPWNTADDTWYADLVKAPKAAVTFETAAMPEAAQKFEHLHEGMEHAKHSAHYIALGISLCMVVFGFLLALSFYHWKKLDAAAWAKRLGPVYTTIVNKYYLDDFNDWVFVRGLIRLCVFIKKSLESFIDFLVNLTGLLVRFVSFFHGLFDKYVVDGLVNFCWWFSQGLSGIFRIVQTGSAKDYLAFALVGALVLSLIMLFVI